MILTPSAETTPLIKNFEKNKHLKESHGGIMSCLLFTNIFVSAPSWLAFTLEIHVISKSHTGKRPVLQPIARHELDFLLNFYIFSILDFHEDWQRICMKIYLSHIQVLIQAFFYVNAYNGFIEELWQLLTRGINLFFISFNFNDKYSLTFR
jgi:hypothetical protein